MHTCIASTLNRYRPTSDPQRSGLSSRPVACLANPLLKFFRKERELLKQQTTQTLAPGQMEVLQPRGYQQELIQIAKNANVLIALPTGSGKTLIAAEVIRHKLPTLKAAGKAVVFLAPTNPLVEQQCNEIFIKKHGLKAIAFHGDVRSHQINTWSADSWQSELSKVDVVVMTPQILLLALCHGSVQMSNIGLLIFDEAHHCGSDHPYAQIMDDFYRHGSSPSESRPQIMGLTASPKGLEGLGGKAGQQGIQYRLNAQLITVTDQCRNELKAQVPVPADELVLINDAGWPNTAITAAAMRLEATGKALSQAAACEGLLLQLQRQAMLVKSGQMTAAAAVQSDLECCAELADIGDSSVSRIDKQVRAVRTCLLQLGPWAAAAAAYLDLLAGRDAGDISQNGFDAAAAAAAGVEVPHKGGDEDDDSANPGAAAGSSVLAESELWKLMGPDNLGNQPEQLIQDFRANIQSVHSWLQQTAGSAPHIISTQELATASLPAAAAAAGDDSSSSTAAWSAAASGLLSLMAKAAIMTVMDVLSELLITDRKSEARSITDPGLHAAAGDAAKRSDGMLQEYGKSLMRQVSFATLQAQIFPNFACSHTAPAWQGPSPLLSLKVTKLIQHLEYQRIEADSTTSNGDWWSVMVFLETKLATLVICKLVQSLPDINQRLKAGFLIGDTDPGGGSSSISMNNKAQAAVVKGFREGRTNVLFATNIGSEGMDFKQCQAVIAFDPPKEVTPYIQARGRARKAGSHYYWLAPDSLEADPKLAISFEMQKRQQDAQLMEDCVRQLSASNRAQLRTNPGAAAAAAAAVIMPYDPSQHLRVPSGGVATLRQAQVLLMAYCANLPGSDTTNLLQAYYSTKQTNLHRTPNRYQTTVYLPSNSGILDPIAGPEMSKKPAAKGAAALAAIEELYGLGKLDEWLQPTWINNRHSQQLEAEPIPKFTYDFSLEHPLGPNTVNFTPGAGPTTVNFTPTSTMKITMHLHSFRLSSSSSSSGTGDIQQQQHVVGVKRPLAAVSAGLQDMLPTVTHTVNPQSKHPSSSSSSSSGSRQGLLNLAVGAADRCAAVPGSSRSSSSSDGSSRVLSFGVLLWEPLPAGVEGPLQWPAWTNQQQQQPYQVTADYSGPVSLTASELLQLMHYQQATDDHINWSNKRLLGVKAKEQQQQQEQQFAKPLQLEAFKEATKSWCTPAAAAAAVDDAVAAELLEGAQICYLFVPLQQQQQQQQQLGIDWASIHQMAQGLKSFAQVVSEVSGITADAQHADVATTAAAAAAAAAVSVDLAPEQVAAVGSHLLDRVVIAGHSSMLYRCTCMDPNITLNTLADFSWKCSSSSSSNMAPAVDGGLHTASSHGEYYQKRYNITNLNPNLPMMAVAGGGRGWKKGLGLLTNPLKPPTLQQKGSRAVQTSVTDLTSPEAAAAAVSLFGVAQQQQGEDDPAAAAAADGSSKPERQEYLPLELCWFLPLTAAAWADLLLLPAFMYRINSLLRTQKMQQQLQQLANHSSSSSAGLRFPVPSAALLAVALTGSSAGEVFDQEGLEYLGDVVLKFIATNYVLQHEPLEANEGELSVKKARLVRNVALAAAARQPPLLLQQHLHLLPYLQPRTSQNGRNRNNGFTPTGWYPRMLASRAAAAAAAAGSSGGSRDLKRVPQASVGLYESNTVQTSSNMLVTEQEERGKKLADGVEALIGAVYLSAAVDTTTAAAASGSSACGSSGDSAPVSMAGVAAAAAFCEAIGVLPQGSADMACKPPLQAFGLHQQQQQQHVVLTPQQQHLQQLLNHSFTSTFLLNQALTHVSVFGVVSYQRLEFLGDALLDLTVSGWLVHRLAAALNQQQQQQRGSVAQVYAPAVLTRARAALVNNTNLGRAAAAAGLQHYINARSRQLTREVRKFVAAAAGDKQDGRNCYSRDVAVVAAAQVGAATAATAAAVDSGWNDKDSMIWKQIWSGGLLNNSSDSNDRHDAAAAAAAAVATDEARAESGDSSSNHPRPPKALADLVESIMGAVFVDSMLQQQQQQQQKGTDVSWDPVWRAVQVLLKLKEG